MTGEGADEGVERPEAVIKLVKAVVVAIKQIPNPRPQPLPLNSELSV
jgi:hypothetical protein